MMIAERRMTTIDKKYSDADTSPDMPGKKYPAKRTIIGSLALHGMNGVSITDILLSSWSSTVLVAKIPGTLHPEPTIKGIKDLPLNPNRLKIRSRKKAILDIYPVVSKMEIQRNNMMS
jgi:hypothetical protein